MSSTVPTECGKCWKCGNTIYIGLAHSCLTAVNGLRTAEPAFQRYLADKEYFEQWLAVGMPHKPAQPVAETLKEVIFQIESHTYRRVDWKKDVLDPLRNLLASSPPQPAQPVAWVARRGNTVHHFSVADGWNVECVATLPEQEGK